MPLASPYRILCAEQFVKEVRAPKRTETIETDSFLRGTHTKGKNESVLRGETWSNCSLPLSSWFPDVTVVFLTFLGLTAGASLSRTQLPREVFATHSCTRVLFLSLIQYLLSCVSHRSENNWSFSFFAPRMFQGPSEEAEEGHSSQVPAQEESE